VLGKGPVAEVMTYHADVTRDGKFWLIRIPEIGRSTQAIRYKDVAAIAGELIEIMTGPTEHTLHISVQLPDSVRANQHANS
jgi:hypothetical protein